MLAVGLDVGAGRVNAVRIRAFDGRFEVVDTARIGPPDAAAFCARAERVAVDAPGGFSRGAHLHDPAVAPKFRTGRCSEIPVPGIPAVSWVTPLAGTGAPGWMQTGFDVWSSLVAAGHCVVETYPAACFHRLNGGRWPAAKTTPAGRAARVSLLSAAGVRLPAGAADWPHDDLDAAVAALVAAAGRPVPHGCADPDGSAMWLPDPPLGAGRRGPGAPCGPGRLGTDATKVSARAASGQGTRA